MKSLVLIAGFMFMAAGAFSQNLILLENGTSCDVVVHLLPRVMGSCTFSPSQMFMVPSGASIPAVAPGGMEWVYARIYEDPNVSCFLAEVETDGFAGGCVTCPPFGIGNFTSVATGGCNGCDPNINFWWTAYCPGGPAHLHMFP